MGRENQRNKAIPFSRGNKESGVNPNMWNGSVAWRPDSLTPQSLV